MSTTDDTRQRSVAEIIGWERGADGPPHRADCEALSDPVHNWCDCSRGPTPDDTLSWLRAQGYTVTMKVLRLRDDEPTIWVESPTYKYAQTAPTLHAALEAAVRAVAEASDG